MSLSEDAAKYIDCWWLLEKATDARFGYTFQADSEGEARMYQLRLHKFRKMRRAHAADYDDFTIKVFGCRVYIRRDIVLDAKLRPTPTPKPAPVPDTLDFDFPSVGKAPRIFERPKEEELTKEEEAMLNRVMHMGFKRRF